MTADTGNDAASKGLLDSRYARSKKDLMKTINDIRATGAAVDVDLPTNVVAGNQSSGKSSLIEAISGIDLPRAVGTCTRVPIEVRLRQEDVKWNCVVKVRKESCNRDATQSSTPEEPFGKPIAYPSQIGDLSAAPSSPSLTPYPTAQPLGSLKQLAFSNDVVVLEITGPEVTDLTLVDLPGLISNGYIAKDCLILLVLTMKDDLNNQSAALLARQADPKGARTIGVLTKADTVTTREDMSKRLKVIHGQEEPLAHGYFVTRQRDADQLKAGITFEAARKNEESFFADKEPWKDLSRALKKRLGTKALTAFLSNRLSSLISAALPGVEAQIAKRQKEIKAELTSLGDKPPRNPTDAIYALITQFGTAIAKHVEGAAGHAELLRSVNALSLTVMKRFARTKPRFVSRERTVRTGPDGVPVNVFHGDSQILPTNYDDEQAESNSEGSHGTDGEDDERASGASSDPDDMTTVLASPSARMYLDDMRIHIENCRTRKLSTHVPLAAFNQLVQRSTSAWDAIATEYVEDARPHVQDMLDKLVEKIFGRYRYGGLPDVVSAVVQDQMHILTAATLWFIGKLVAMERRPFTLNAHYLESNHAKHLTQLKDPRIAQVATHVEDNTGGALRQKHVNAVLSYLALLGLQGVKEEDLPKLLPAIAYWKVSYKRIIDNIPRILDLELLQPLARTMSNALLRGLNVSGDEGTQRCKDLLEEEPAVAEMRHDLEVRRDRLGAAKLTIRQFKMK